MRSTLVSVLATTVGLLAGSVALAGPAAADHIVSIRPSSCSAGVFTFDVYGDVQTRNRRDVAIARHVDGTVVVTCTFRGLPKQRWNEVLEEVWHRPPPGTVRPVTACVLSDHLGRPFPGRGDWYGPGTVTYGPGGRATTVCTFTPDYFTGA